MRGGLFAYSSSQRDDIPIHAQRFDFGRRRKPCLRWGNTAGSAQDYSEVGFALYLQRAVGDVFRWLGDGDCLSRRFRTGEYRGFQLGGALVRECNLFRGFGQPLQRNIRHQQF